MISKAKKRIFIAIDLPQELKTEMKKKIEKIENLPIRFLLESTWHLTPVFLGDLNNGEIEALKTIAEIAAEKIRPFALILEKFEWAPPNRTPRMLWLSLAKSQEFSDLAVSLEKEIIKRQKDGIFKQFRKSARPSHPHVTLARFQEEDWPLIQKDMEKRKIILPALEGAFEVKSIDMMESRLSREGAEYSRIENFSFQ